MPISFSRLRIAGFKSFAEPAVVHILPGLTGVVGPNGCGKSNVVEALRWAMGETSAKACGSYAFGIDFGHLFKDEMGSAAAADPISAVMGMVPLLGGAPEVNRALYEALENMPEATNLYAPRSYVVTSGLAPFGVPIFGKRCAEVKAHGVKLGKGPVPNAH